MDIYISDNQKKKKIIVDKSIPIQILKVEIPANSASITPPLGPLLGQYGININEFCKEFNDETLIFEKDTIIPVIIYLSYNKSYYFVFKTLTIAYLIKKIIDSEEKENLIYLKEDFLKMAYDICFFKLYIFNKKSNLKISEKYFKKYLNSIIGTMRSFGLVIKN